MDWDYQMNACDICNTWDSSVCMDCSKCEEHCRCGFDKPTTLADIACLAFVLPIAAVLMPSALLCGWVARKVTGK